MTLDEAIKHAEKVAKRERENAQVYDKVKNNNLHHPDKITCEQAAERCRECAEEQRQLAEWLKELKQLREQTRWIPVSERYPTDTNKCYLVFYEDGCITIEHLYFDGDGHPFFSEMELGVVGWMPLPENPYKGKPDR